MKEKPEIVVTCRDETDRKGSIIWSVITAIILIVLYTYSPHNILLALIVFHVMFSIFLLFTKGIIVSAYKDRLDLGEWPNTRRPHRVPANSITAIDTTENCADYYLPRTFFWRGYIRKDIKGWHTFVWTDSEKGVMVQTDEMNYMFSCPDAEGVAEKMRQLYGVGKGNIEPPPLKVKFKLNPKPEPTDNQIDNQNSHSEMLRE